MSLRAALPLLVCLLAPAAALAKSTPTAPLTPGKGHDRGRLLGAWKVESVTFRIVDGPVLAEPYGARPAGSVFFSANGRFGAQITRRDLKPFAVADPGKGTPEEMIASFRGNVSYYGTYTVDEKARSIAMRVEGGLFPNWAGQPLKRFFELRGGKLYVRSPPFMVDGKMTVGETVLTQ